MTQGLANLVVYLYASRAREVKHKKSWRDLVDALLDSGIHNTLSRALQQAFRKPHEPLETDLSH